MCRTIHYFRSLVAIAAALLFVGGADAAGLVGFRNDTQQAVVVQSTIVSNGVTRRSKPQTLYPGETALDSLAFTGTRSVTVYDSKKPSVVLMTADVNSTDDVFYSIQTKTATVAIKNQPPPAPKFVLVKSAPPSMPKPKK